MHHLPAISALRRLVVQAPHLPAMRLQLAQALLDAGAPADAIAEADACLGQDPTLAEAWLVRAQALLADGAYPAASRDFEYAAALAPDRPLILVSLAACHLHSDQPAQAEAALRRAIALAPHCAPALANLGSVLVRRGALAEAEAPCRAALALDVSLVAAHQNLSGILAETDPAAARAHRDAAYRRQQIFIDGPQPASRTVLVLAAADAGNVPLQHLFDRTQTALVTWYVEYAQPGQDAALPPFDLVFNAIGDPDLAPVLPAPVRRMLRRAGSALLNEPRRVARTARSSLPRLLAGIQGVLVPPVLRHDGGPSLHAAAARLGLPLLVRPLGSHGGNGLSLAQDSAALARCAGGPGYATQFVDTRDDDGWYRKYRMIFVDRRPYPYHLAIGPTWMIHHCTTGMEQDATRQAEEQQFLNDPAASLGQAAMAALTAIGARLDLDYAGIDFGRMRDGRIVVFEANATMQISPEQGVFSYRNPALHTIQAAFETMLAARLS